MIPKPLKNTLLQKNASEILISIGGVPYQVSFLPWKEVDHNSKAEHLFGQIDYLKHSIHIASDVPVEKQQLSLLHEVIHGIISEFHIKELQNEQGEHSEQAIDLLSLGLFTFLNSIKMEIPHGT